MAYRYTEKELTDIKARQAVNLANFERNSGRGLPKETLEQMERGQGVKLDHTGNVLTVPVIPGKPKKAKKRAKKGPKPHSAPPAEAAVIQELERGGHPISGRNKGIAPMNAELPGDRTDRLARSRGKSHAPAIARHRIRAECDGIKFDSTLEMRRYKELKLLKASGTINYFLRQVPFHLPGGIVARIDFLVVYPIFHEGSRHWGEKLEYEDCKAGANGRSKGRYNDADRVGVNKRKQIKALYGVTVKLVTKARA
jgi:hypothetical protein